MKAAKNYSYENKKDFMEALTYCCLDVFAITCPSVTPRHVIYLRIQRCSVSNRNVLTHRQTQTRSVYHLLCWLHLILMSEPVNSLHRWLQCGWGWRCGNQGELVCSLIGVIKDELSRFHPGVIYPRVLEPLPKIFLWFRRNSCDWDLLFGPFGGKISKPLCIPALLLKLWLH